MNFLQIMFFKVEKKKKNISKIRHPILGYIMIILTTYSRSDVDKMWSDRQMLELYTDDRGCRSVPFILHIHCVRSRNQRSIESGTWTDISMINGTFSSFAVNMRFDCDFLIALGFSFGLINKFLKSINPFRF